MDEPTNKEDEDDQPSIETVQRHLSQMPFAKGITRSVVTARMWADARKVGLSTAAPDALDGDVILAAQALEYAGADDRLVIATGNKSDLSRYVGERAQPWELITP